jgi:hypothetical protein
MIQLTLSVLIIFTNCGLKLCNMENFKTSITVVNTTVLSPSSSSLVWFLFDLFTVLVNKLFMDQVYPPISSLFHSVFGCLIMVTNNKIHVNSIVFFLLGTDCRAIKVPELPELRWVHTTASGMPGWQTRMC